MFPGPRYGGGALSVYLDGEPVVDVWTGWSDRRGTTHWTADTGAMVFSATKGMASTVIHRLVDRALIDYEAPVAEYWPEFGANGKAKITVREVMRHRAGLSHLNGVSKADLMDHRKMEERLAAASVNRVLYGKGAYHALTYGWLMSGLARAVTGKGMRDLIREELAEPLNTDGLHLGRPPAEAPTKAAQIIIPQGTLPNSALGAIVPKLAALQWSGGLGALYFPEMVSVVQGDTPFLDGELPAANGVATARGLAKMYAALAYAGRIDGTQFLSTELAAGLIGKPSLSPDRNIIFPMGIPPRLPRNPDPRPDAGLRPRRSGWIAGLGRPRQRTVVRLRAQPAAHPVRGGRPGRLRRYRGIDSSWRRGRAQAWIPAGAGVRRAVRVPAAACRRVGPYASSIRKPTFSVTWKCPTAPSAMWPRTEDTSNQSSPRMVSAARDIALRIAASTLSGELPTISMTR